MSFFRKVFYFSCLLICSIAFSQDLTQKQKDIIVKYLDHGAYGYHYLDQEWENNIEKAIKEDSTIALLWQRRALPYWKTRKYTIALDYYNKAVQYDRREYLGRRGYLNCIFSKDYKSALKDFDNASAEFGEGIENDHTYNFYRALCYLQLNLYNKAEEYINLDLKFIEKKFGKDWISPSSYFYLGVIKYEQREYKAAVSAFDLALQLQPKFSDALYYKALCLYKINKDNNELNSFMSKVSEYYASGNSFNENGALYEKYPYQISKWEIDAFLKK
ncbi:MAG: tetratricopeptide repeat protein [Chryseobacterium jejuense]|uniref:tetratricopeptide repeat protein n=1 Tax=Chryseobacterium jejuense TaxID=445960 RepID=UPI003D0E9AEE